MIDSHKDISPLALWFLFSVHYLFSFLLKAPEGLSPPLLSLTAATAVLATWQPPAHPNGNLTGYQLVVVGPGFRQELQFTADTTSAAVSDLPPFTVHQVTVIASNPEGNITSTVATIRTGETGLPQKDKSRYNCS